MNANWFIFLKTGSIFLYVAPNRANCALFSISVFIAESGSPFDLSFNTSSVILPIRLLFSLPQRRRTWSYIAACSLVILPLANAFCVSSSV